MSTPQGHLTSRYSIQKLPAVDRPRERLLRHGAESMATAELIAIVLGSGMRGLSVLDLAQEIVQRFGSLQQLAEATVEELCQIKGLGVAKALQLKAAFSLGLRASRLVMAPKIRIEHPSHAYHLVKDLLEHEKKELFVVILQDVRGCVICHQTIAMGTLSQTLVHPREVFYPAVRHSAASVILVHNHPSGDPTPSKQDYEVTQALVEVGKLMGIPVNDHLIIGVQGYVSLRQLGVAFF